MIRNAGIYFIAAIFLSGCYGSNHLTADYGFQPVYSSDSGMIAFALYPKVFRPARGIARFPDGGISKTVYSDLIVYLYDIENHTLKNLYNYPEIPYHSRSRWACQFQFSDDVLYFSVSPSGGWESLIQSPVIDSSLVENYSGWFTYRFSNGKVTKIMSPDTLSFHGIPARFGEMTKLLKGYTWTDYGLFLSDILPDTKKEVVKDLEKLEGNREYRETIIEQYVKDMDPKQIQGIIRRIERNTKKFSDNEMRTKRIAREETLELLNSLLN